MRRTAACAPASLMGWSSSRPSVPEVVGAPAHHRAGKTHGSAESCTLNAALTTQTNSAEVCTDRAGVCTVGWWSDDLAARSRPQRAAHDAGAPAGRARLNLRRTRRPQRPGPAHPHRPGTRPHQRQRHHLAHPRPHLRRAHRAPPGHPLRRPHPTRHARPLTPRRARLGSYRESPERRASVEREDARKIVCSVPLGWSRDMSPAVLPILACRLARFGPCAPRPPPTAATGTAAPALSAAPERSE